jgi:hypothetical protein
MKKALKLSKISTPTSKQDESVRPIERIVEGLSKKNRNFESVGEAANQVSVKDSFDSPLWREEWHRQRSRRLEFLFGQIHYLAPPVLKIELRVGDSGELVDLAKIFCISMKCEPVTLFARGTEPLILKPPGRMRLARWLKKDRHYYW